MTHHTGSDEGLSEAERIAAGRIKHGVGSSEDFPGNVSHLVSPIVGTMRLRQRDGQALPDMGWIIDRLSLVLDMARTEAARAAAPDALREALVAWFHAELGGECIARHRDVTVVPPCENWADQFLRTGPMPAAALRVRVEALADEWRCNCTTWHDWPCQSYYGDRLRAALAERPTDGAGT